MLSVRILDLYYRLVRIWVGKATDLHERWHQVLLRKASAEQWAEWEGSLVG